MLSLWQAIHTYLLNGWKDRWINELTKQNWILWTGNIITLETRFSVGTSYKIFDTTLQKIRVKWMAPLWLPFSYKIPKLLTTHTHRTQHTHSDAWQSMLGISTRSPASRQVRPVSAVAPLLCSWRCNTVGLNAILREFFSCSKMPNWIINEVYITTTTFFQNLNPFAKTWQSKIL